MEAMERGEGKEGGREGREWLGDEKNDKECNGKRMAERIG
jgi:hypothetical protein